MQHPTWHKESMLDDLSHSGVDENCCACFVVEMNFVAVGEIIFVDVVEMNFVAVAEMNFVDVEIGDY